MLIESFLKRDTRSITTVVPQQIVGPYVLLITVLTRSQRATLNFAISTGLSASSVTATNILNIGPNMRFVVFTDHVERQYRDSGGIWHVKDTFDEF